MREPRRVAGIESGWQQANALMLMQDGHMQCSLMITH
jgi:hypothetical protein